MKALLNLGISHATAPVGVRERLAPLCGRALPEADGRRLEAVSVLTCNRVEVFFRGEAGVAERSFAGWLTVAGASPTDIAPFLQRRQGTEVVRHLFRLAAGLDSMVLGEAQILHQIKQAYQASIEAGTVGHHLHALFQRAIAIGKRVRTETRIGENTVSIASTAVELAMQVFGPLSGCTGLIVGAGEMATLVARHLVGQRIGRLVITNRTASRAEELAAQFQGETGAWEDLPRLLGDADVVITSTGAPAPILGRELVAAAIARRPWRPLFLIDIAVPRDVDRASHDLENVYVYDIDDLQGVVDEHLGHRRVEADKAAVICDHEAGSFELAQNARPLVPLIRGLRERMEDIRLAELARFQARWQGVDPAVLAALDECTRAMLAKWLHHPLVVLKETGTADAAQAAWFARLFGLPPEAIDRPVLVAVPPPETESEHLVTPLPPRVGGGER